MADDALLGFRSARGSLDRSLGSWKTPATVAPVPIAKLHTTTILRLAGAAGIVVYLFGGALQGILQQAPDLPPQEIDCGYRIELLRARLTTAILSNRADSISGPFDSDNNRISPISNLLRQTLRHCPQTHPELNPELDALQRSHDELVELHMRTAQVYDRLREDDEGLKR